MLPERLGNLEADHYGQLIAHHLGLQTLEINISPVLRALGTSNPFLAALSGRECWKRTVNRYLQKQGQTAGAF